MIIDVMTAAVVAERLERVVRELAVAVAGLDPESVSGDEAARLTAVFSRIVGLGSAGRLVAARRVADCEEAWRQGGRYRSAEDWLGAISGTDHRDARRELKTGARLKKLPKVAQAVRSGELSPRVTDEVVRASSVAPGRQEAFIAAGRQSLGTIRDLRRRTETEARSREDDKARAGRHHATRFAWFGTDAEGMGVLNARMAPEKMAEIRGLVEEDAELRLAAAQRSGKAESAGAYRADALLAFVRRSHAASGRVGWGAEEDGSRPGTPRHRMLLRVDLPALLRGWATGDEIVEIPGCGSVPVTTARDLLGEALLTLVVTDGVDIRTVCSAGRHVQAAVDLALRWRDPTCVVPDCDRVRGLERDHWRVDHAAGGPTSLDNLALLCRFHHSQKTQGNWNLSGGPGRWAWTPARRRPKGKDPPPPG